MFKKLSLTLAFFALITYISPGKIKLIVHSVKAAITPKINVRSLIMTARKAWRLNKLRQVK